MPVNHQILQAVKASLAAVLPSHALKDLPSPTRLADLGVEDTIHQRVLTQTSIILSSITKGSVRGFFLRQSIPLVPNQTVGGLASAVEQALKDSSAFSSCPPPNLPDEPTSTNCNAWKNSSVSCGILLAIEDWADPNSIPNGIAPSRTLNSFHSIGWNLGLLSALVQATNARQPFAPFLHEVVTFPAALPPASTTVTQWRSLVIQQLRSPKTKCL